MIHSWFIKTFVIVLAFGLVVFLSCGKKPEPEPMEYGRIIITGTDSVGKALEKSFYMYASGDKENVVISGITNEPLNVQAAFYDVRVNLEPDVWYAGVEITREEDKVINLPQWGRLEIVGKDTAGEWLSDSFAVYARGEKEKIIANGYVNRTEELPPGIYDIRVDLKPDIWYEAVEVTAGQSKVVDLSKTGRLEIQGESLDARFRVYANGEREEEITIGYANVPADRSINLLPGTYDIKVESHPEVWYEGVEITAGQSRVIDLPQTGRLEIQGAWPAARFDIYPREEQKKVITSGYANIPADRSADLLPGIYDIKVNTKPLVWYEAIEIKPGQSTVINLTE